MAGGELTGDASVNRAGVTILMVEQNARSALEISDYGIVLETGRTRLIGQAHDVLSDPRVARLFLGAEVDLNDDAA